jgi:excisionase family DNA binding protein
MSAGSDAPAERLLTFGQAAEILGISLRQLRRLIDGGRIPFVRVSERTPRVRASDIQSFVVAAVVNRAVGGGS